MIVFRDPDTIRFITLYDSYQMLMNGSCSWKGFELYRKQRKREIARLLAETIERAKDGTASTSTICRNLPESAAIRRP